jgi:hypothetical protein
VIHGHASERGRVSNTFRNAVVAACAYTVFCGVLGQMLPLRLLRGEWLQGSTAPAASPTVAVEPSVSSSPEQNGARIGKPLPALQDSPENLARCKENLAALGATVEKLGNVQDFKALADATPGKDRCPTTRLRYRWIDAAGRSFVFCSGRGHGDVAPHWDSAAGVAERWPEFTDDTGDEEKFQLAWGRYHAAQWDDRWTQCLELARLLKQLSSDKKWSTLREAECQLYLGNLEEADTLSEAVRTESPESADALNIRAYVLLADDECEAAAELAKQWAAKEPSNESPRILHVLALGHLGEWDAAEKLAEQVADPLFRTYSDLAYKRYAASTDNAERTAREQGWDLPYTSHALLNGVLAGALSGEPEKASRERLSRAVEQVPKAWPYPCFRFLNGDISEAELLAGAGDISVWVLEAKYTIALDLLARKKDNARARQLLAEVAEERFYFESLVAAALLRP